MKQAGNSFRKLFSALLVAILLVCNSIPAFAASKGDILRVRADFARLRSQPQAGSDVVAKVRRGTKVVYRGEKGGWIILQLADGTKGYMYKSMLTTYSAPKKGKVYTSRVSKLPVYAKASSGAKRLGTLKSSSEVVLLGRKGSWGLIRVVRNGRVGYVNLRYLRAN